MACTGNFPFTVMGSAKVLDFHIHLHNPRLNGHLFIVDDFYNISVFFKRGT